MPNKIHRSHKMAPLLGKWGDYCKLCGYDTYTELDLLWQKCRMRKGRKK